MLYKQVFNTTNWETKKKDNNKENKKRTLSVLNEGDNNQETCLTNTKSISKEIKNVQKHFILLSFIHV